MADPTRLSERCFVIAVIQLLSKLSEDLKDGFSKVLITSKDQRDRVHR